MYTNCNTTIVNCKKREKEKAQTRKVMACSDVSLEWFTSVKSRPYVVSSPCQPSKWLNRENNNLLLFFEPLQIAIFCWYFDGKAPFYKNWFEKNIMRIEDLLHNDGKFFSFNQFLINSFNQFILKRLSLFISD